MTPGDLLRDEELLFALGGVVCGGAWFWTFFRVAMMPLTWLKWVALALCFLPRVKVEFGDAVVIAPVLFPVALLITLFAVKRPRPSARTTLERMTGG